MEKKKIWLLVGEFLKIFFVFFIVSIISVGYVQGDVFFVQILVNMIAGMYGVQLFYDKKLNFPIAILVAFLFNLVMLLFGGILFMLFESFSSYCFGQELFTSNANFFLTLANSLGGSFFLSEIKRRSI